MKMSHYLLDSQWEKNENIHIGPCHQLCQRVANIYCKLRFFHWDLVWVEPLALQRHEEVVDDAEIAVNWVFSFFLIGGKSKVRKFHEMYEEFVFQSFEMWYNIFGRFA